MNMYRPRRKVDRERFEQLVAEYGEPTRQPKSGFRWPGCGVFAVKDTVYGQRRQCLWCGKTLLGSYRNDHLGSCPVEKAKLPEKISRAKRGVQLAEQRIIQLKDDLVTAESDLELAKQKLLELEVQTQ